MGVAAAAAAVSNGTVAPTHYSVRIGAVLDSNSFMGAMIDVCISMARWDFYATHADYRTRLDIHRKYAHNDFDMTSAGFIYVHFVFKICCYIISARTLHLAHAK